MKDCEGCYYEFFGARAYPCSLCIRGVERQDMWKEKIRDCRWTVELKRDEESCKKIFEICKKCKESAARLFDGERYVVCTKVGTPPKHVICFELSECPLKKWKFEDEPPKMGSIKRPTTGICAKCGRADCEQKMEHIDNCNGYIEPQTERSNMSEIDKMIKIVDGILGDDDLCEGCEYVIEGLSCAECRRKYADKIIKILRDMKHEPQTGMPEYASWKDAFDGMDCCSMEVQDDNGDDID